MGSILNVDLKQVNQPLRGKWSKPVKGIHYHLKMCQAVQRECGSPPQFKYKGFADFVLQAGRPFEPGPLHEYNDGEAQQCFMNAYYLMEKGLHYVEGYAVTERALCPVIHAWNLDSKGRLVDNTWVKFHPKGYYGVVFSSGFVRRAALSSGFYGILENPVLMRNFALYPLTSKSERWKCRSRRILGSH